jgi:hypothetical protein
MARSATALAQTLPSFDAWSTPPLQLVPPPSPARKPDKTDGYLGDDWLAAHITVDARIALAEIAVRETGEDERIAWVVRALEGAMRVRAALYDLRWRLDAESMSDRLAREAPSAVYVAAVHLWSRDLVDELLALAERSGSVDAWEETRLDVADGAEMFLFACLAPLYRDVEDMGSSGLVLDAAALEKQITLLCADLASG